MEELLERYKVSKVLSISEKGNRLVNEDYILIRKLTGQDCIYLVADGMGGYNAGEIASKEVCNSIKNYLVRNITENRSMSKLIVEACNYANTILEEKRNEIGTKLGTTIAGTIIYQNNAYCFWLGDVRIIHFRTNKMLFQSEDHSFINQLRAQNIEVSPNGFKKVQHIVTKSIMGDKESLLPDIKIIENLTSNDKLLICTDGVHSVINTKEMEILFQSLISEKQIIKSISERCELNGTDNYSALFISDF